MSTSLIASTKPLIAGVSQFEVDFVIPRLGVDVPVGIDPFLLFKSRDPELRQLHRDILELFNAGVTAVSGGDFHLASQIFQFPEVSEIGLGYTKGGKHGSGVGTYLTALIVDTLRASPQILERGIRHIEEMQLVALGIGPDRVSDITANLIKRFLITYTQKQCALWNIPLQSNVPVGHISDIKNRLWEDDFCDLPVSPFDNSAILLVPRRIVRALPWINYGEFSKLEFATYLRAKATKQSMKSGVPVGASKRKVVAISKNEIKRIDHYIRLKEETAKEAQPSTSFVDENGASAEADSLKERLKNIKIGAEQAADYQKLVLEALNFLFAPELIDGELEVRTIDGTERRDIIFTNDSDESFWDYIRTEHSALFLMFEIKNTASLVAAALNQTATYLGDRLGRLGFIVTRNIPGESQMRKAFAIYNDSQPKKIILFLSDIELAEMLNIKASGANPMRFVQKLYRKFRTRVQ